MSLRPRFMFSIVLVMMPVIVLLLVFGMLDATRMHVLQMKVASRLASRIVEGNLGEHADVAAAAELSTRDLSHLGFLAAWAVTDRDMNVRYKEGAPELAGRLLGSPVADAVREAKTKIAGNIVGVPLRRNGKVVGGFWARVDPASIRSTFPASRTGTLVFLMILAMAFITLITYTAVSTQLLGPLEKLSDGAKRVAGGDYSRPVNAPGARGEAQQLVDAFNDMMSQVRESRADLQSRIEDAAEKISEGSRHLAIAQKLTAAGQLAAGVAHEINNPLGGMMNVTRKLADSGLSDEKRKEYVGLLKKGLDSVKSTVDKLLHFAPRTTRVTIIDLANVASDALAFVGHYAAEHHVDIRVSVHDGLCVQADVGELRQVFVNLLLNGVDAAEGEGKIEIRSETSGGRISLFFEDDGRGMSEEQISHAFEVFFTTKDPGKGSGLGLPIASSIVERYGGKTRIESEPGKGTTVTIEFPRAASASAGGEEHES